MYPLIGIFLTSGLSDCYAAPGGHEHAAGLKLFPFNVDTFEDCVKMFDMKVDGVITVDPVSGAHWSHIRYAA